MSNKITTFEEACAAISAPAVNAEGVPVDEVAYQKLKVIVEALNGGWKPDWTDMSQRKWYPYFVMNPDNFSLFSVFYGDGVSDVSSRLCFKDEETAEYAATQFLDLYKQYTLG